MSNLKIDYLHPFIFVFLFLLTPFCLSATTYTAVVSGNWNSALTWGGNMPGNTISGEDQIIIGAGVQVNMNVDVELNNQLAVMTLLGTLENSEHTLTVTAGTVTGTGELVVQTVKIGAMGAVLTTGNIICDVFETSSTSLSLGASLQIAQMLKLMAGQFQLESSGEIVLNTNATIQVENGTLAINDGIFQTMGSVNLLYTGNSQTTGPETTVGTIANLTLQLSGDSETLTLSNDLTVTDSTRLLSGMLVLNGQGLTLEGAVQNESNAAVQGDAAANLSLSGSADVSIIFSGQGNELDTLTINQNGGSFTLGSDLTVHQFLNVEAGTCLLGGHQLTIRNQLQTAAGATITTDEASSLSLNGQGSLQIFLTSDSSSIGSLTINQTDGDVSFSTHLTVTDSLRLQLGNLILLEKNLTLGAGAEITGGGEGSYVLTSGDGTLRLQLEAGAAGTLFPVGSEEGYFPCVIGQNEGSSDTQIEVRIMKGVFAEGETGTDLTLSESLVDHTWLISQTDANASVDLDFEFFWQAEAAVNGFDPAHCYISHFTNGSWDVAATAEATLHADGYFSVTRENLTSLSPFRVKDQMVLAIGVPGEDYFYFKMYPNPAQDFVQIELPQELTNRTLHIFDQAGKLALEQFIPANTHNLRVDLNGLENGLYLMKIQGAVGQHFVIED